MSRRRSGSTGGRRRVDAPADLKPADVRALGRAFDALVRSARTHGQVLPGAAERAHAVWLTMPGEPLHIAPTRVTVGGRPALDEDEHDIRWLLPAFMAGLRKLTPKAEMSAEDLRLLADAVARLESDVTSIERFRDWLWSGSATGFEIELQNSFMEALEDAAVDAPVAGGTYEPALAVAAVRTEVMRSLSQQAVMISARMLAEAAQRDEFDLPLGSAAGRADSALFAVAPTEAAALRGLCEDADRWSLDETVLLLAYRPLHELSRPERVARTVLALVKRDAHGAVTALMDALTGLTRRNDPFARDLLRVLDREAFAEALAASLLKDPANARRVVEVLLSVGPVTVAQLATSLLDHAAREPAWVVALTEMMQSSGGRLAPILLDAAPVPSATQIPVLVRIVGDGVLETLFARARAASEAWIGRSFGALCRAAIERGMGTSLVLPFIRDRAIPADARVEALDIVQYDRGLAAEATLWRPVELFDAPAVREKLRSLREAARRQR